MDFITNAFIIIVSIVYAIAIMALVLGAGYCVYYLIDTIIKVNKANS